MTVDHFNNDFVVSFAGCDAIIKKKIQFRNFNKSLEVISKAKVSASKNKLIIQIYEFNLICWLVLK